jgi:3-hydroxyisobutyrate dehydrogenase-like beta-hydroxyacid dehydrogenase
MAVDDAPLKVGVVGLGKMGHALADSLLIKGFEVTVWNRSPAKADPLAAAGAKLAASAAEAASSTDVLVVCLSDYPALEATLMTDELGSALRGQILVDVTSLRLADLRELVGWTEANGVSLLQGTILAYPDDVRSGTCSILYGGARGTFDAVAPLLQAMGGSARHMGDAPDAGVKMARAYFCFLFPALVAFVHGAALCHRAGMPVETYARDLVLPALAGPMLPGMLERLAKASEARRYDQDVQATLDIWNGALAGVIDTVRSYRLDPGLLSAMKELLDRTTARGFGEQDLAAVLETLMGEDRPAAPLST